MIGSAIQHSRLHMNYYIHMFYQMSQWHTSCWSFIVLCVDFVHIFCIWQYLTYIVWNAWRISCVYNVSLCTYLVYSYCSQSCIPTVIHACHKSHIIVFIYIHLYTYMHTKTYAFHSNINQSFRLPKMKGFLNLISGYFGGGFSLT